MPTRVSVSSVGEQSGSLLRDFQEEVADGVRRFSCSLWSRFPDQVSQNRSLGTSFVRGYMSGLCRDGDLPPPPPINGFRGGQCIGVSYEVLYKVSRTAPDTCEAIPPQYFFRTYNGAIEPPIVVPGTTVVGTHSCFGQTDADYVQANLVAVHAGGTESLVTGAFYDPALSSSGNLSTIEILRVNRIDGEPDDCNDPESAYPPTAPTAGDYSTNITINLDDGGDVVIPVTYAPVTVGFPMTFDVGGVSVELNFSGVQFNFGGRSGGGTPEGLPGGEPTPVPVPLDDLRRFPTSQRNPAPGDVLLRERPLPEAPSQEEEDIEDLHFVTLELTNYPKNIKRQSGSGAPNVLYAGWFEFKSKTFNYPRQPIHFERNIFNAPTHATGFAYTLYNGIIGTAIIHVLK